jgi:DNA-binding LacI/PurR family transcriptional regulator
MTGARDRTAGRPTIDQVAALAGVGRGTVSRVINGSPLVSPHTHDAVRKAIDELGYVPNRAARSLVTRRTESVALVVSESEQRVFSEPFFARVIRGIGAALGDSGYQLWLAMAQSPAERERLSHHLTGQHVDGVLLLSLHGEDPLPYLLAERGLPVVLGGRPSSSRPVSWVDADNSGGARQAVEHLLERGRQQVATITGPQDMAAGVERMQGYRDALRGAGIDQDPELVAYGDFSEASGVAAMTQLLARRPEIDAVFAASDPMALGALQVLRAHGRPVPGDVAVVGFDDSDSARHSDPPLTTVHQPADAMGREMARLLLARIDGAPTAAASQVLLDTHLMIRASS